MRRTALALALACAIGLAPALGLAQSSIVSQIAGDKAATEKLYFSVKLGLNLAHLSGNEDLGRVGGFNVGLMATIKITERLSLWPEVTLASRKGVADIPFTATGDPAIDPYFEDPASSALVLSYLDIPVLVKYGRGRIHVGAGPFVGFLSSASERFQAELADGEELSYKRDVAAEYRSLDYGFVFEASWTMTKPRRGTGLVFHIRYQAGLADVLKDPAAPGAMRTSVVHAYLSFPFIH
jgi:hypothetical protein